MQNYHPILGELQSVHRTPLGRRILLRLAVTAAAALGLYLAIITFDATDVAASVIRSFCCAFIPVGVWVFMLADLFATAKDELRIYRSGFIYYSGRDMQTCLWTEIADVDSSHGTINAIEKTSGELIVFSIDKKGNEELERRIRAELNISGELGQKEAEVEDEEAEIATLEAELEREESLRHQSNKI